MSSASSSQAPASATGSGTLPKNHLWIALSVMLATIMQAIDSTIANVALPHMQGTMSATHDQAAWILTSYIVAAAVMTAPSGYLAMRFGRKQIFIVTIIGFTLTSMLCGMANSVPEMVLYRILQGVFGAGFVPLSQAVLLDTYPREKQGMAMSVWSMGVMLGPIIGPTLGGYLTDALSWRWVFYINLPLGILALAGVIVFLPEPAEKKRTPFDWTGFLLLSIAVGATQMMLERGEAKDWFSSTEVVIEAVIAGLTLYLFVMHMLTSRTKTFLEPALFADRNFVTGLFYIFVTGILLMATMAILPQFLQQMLGYPVALAGEVLAPRGLGSMFGMLLAGRLISRIDIRILIISGLAFCALALWQMSHFSLDTTRWQILRSGFLQGFGMGLFVVPMSTLSYATLSAELRNEAAGIFSLLRNMGGSVGISVVVGLLTTQTQVNHSELAERVSVLNPNLIAAQASGALDLQSAQGLAQLNAEITRQASTIAYLNDFTFLMYVALLSMPLLLLMKNAAVQQDNASEKEHIEM
jgi:DHA2 family multidrug resistance protein